MRTSSRRRTRLLRKRSRISSRSASFAASIFASRRAPLSFCSALGASDSAPAARAAPRLRPAVFLHQGGGSGLDRPGALSDNAYPHPPRGRCARRRAERARILGRRNASRHRDPGGVDGKACRLPSGAAPTGPGLFEEHAVEPDGQSRTRFHLWRRPEGDALEAPLADSDDVPLAREPQFRFSVSKTFERSRRPSSSPERCHVSDCLGVTLWEAHLGVPPVSCPFGARWSVGPQREARSPDGA